MKRIFILNGHPASTSLNQHLSQTYASAATAAGHEVRIMHISEMNFDPDFGVTKYENAKELEPVLQEFLDNLRWCEHFVLTAPQWWGSLPAKTKGLFDRVFLPGTTFDPRNPNKIGFPGHLLSGRTARFITTATLPYFFFRLAYKRPLETQVRKQILGFCGISPTKVTYFSGAENIDSATFDKWTAQVKNLGTRGI